MTRIPDLPPTHNEPSPAVAKHLVRELESLGSLDGLPFFRLVWGQDRRVVRFWQGVYHFKYRHHCEKKYFLGEPEYGGDGKLVGYKRLYEPKSVLPDIILHPVERVKEIGIPRFFLEILTFHKEDEWNDNRYTNEWGQVELDENGDAVDFLGEYPKGGLDYEPLLLIADHQGCCKELTLSGHGKKEDGSTCFGFRRSPAQSDVDEVKARFASFNASLRRSDLREDVSEAELLQIGRDNLNAMSEYWQKIEEQIYDDTFQALTPHTKRLTSHGHGLDQFKYVDMGGALAKLRENASDPSAYTGKTT